MHRHAAPPPLRPVPPRGDCPEGTFANPECGSPGSGWGFIWGRGRGGTDISPTALPQMTPLPTARTHADMPPPPRCLPILAPALRFTHMQATGVGSRAQLQGGLGDVRVITIPWAGCHRRSPQDNCACMDSVASDGSKIVALLLCIIALHYCLENVRKFEKASWHCGRNRNRGSITGCYLSLRQPLFKIALTMQK